jgi:NADH-quinone oxidoreductase subunit J
VTSDVGGAQKVWSGMTYALYIASACGAVTLLLMMPRQGFNPRVIGAVLGAMTLGGLWLYLGRQLPDALGIDQAAMVYYYVFSAIAIFAAARVITHTQPVFSALWFVMVVLAVAGLLLALGAEFIAAAIVIIYGGAILVTYIFVMMLAAPLGNTASQVVGHYDRVAREPVAAVLVASVLMATMLTVFFEHASPNEAAAAEPDAALLGDDGVLSNRAAQRVELGSDAIEQVDNAERIGLDMFRGHPLGIELAGIVLLVALVGAVVIARQSTLLHGQGTTREA